MRWRRAARPSPATTIRTWWPPPSRSGSRLYEGLLAESPKHAGLLLAAASGFTEYSYAFVDLKAEEAKEENLDRANAMTERARKLYLRANALRHARAGSSASAGSARRWITTPQRR